MDDRQFVSWMQLSEVENKREQIRQIVFASSDEKLRTVFGKLTEGKHPLLNEQDVNRVIKHRDQTAEGLFDLYNDLRKPGGISTF